MRQKIQHSIKGWSVGGVLLESYHYAPGPAIALPRHAHEEYQFGLSLDEPGRLPLSRRKVRRACRLPGRHPSRRAAQRLRQSSGRALAASYDVRATQPASAGADSGMGRNGPQVGRCPSFPNQFCWTQRCLKCFWRCIARSKTPCSRLEQDSRLLSALTRLIYSAAQFRPDFSGIVSPAPVSSRRDPVRLTQEFSARPLR